MKKTLLLFSLLIGFSLWSQKYKFGKVSKKELQEKSYKLDKDAPAAMLYKERVSRIELTKDGAILKEEYYFRLKIYKTEGFDYATVKIPVYDYGNDKEDLLGIRGITFNLINGKVVKTKLKSKNIYTKRMNKYYTRTSFTMPNIKPGSVVEWKYIIFSPFMQTIDEIKLQSSIPIKKLHVRFASPTYFKYAQKLKGFLKVPIETSSSQVNVSINHFDRENNGNRIINAIANYEEDMRIIDMKNIPALIDEPYSGNIDNYTSGIVYELGAIKDPNKAPETFTTDWESVAKKVYFSNKFGKQLKKSSYLKNDIKNLTKNISDDYEKLKKILAYAKKKIKWDGFLAKFTDNGVEKSYSKGTGNAADVNLNLVNMLNNAGIEAYPVLVSSLDHGIALFPSITSFDFVIAGVKTDKGIILLDATSKYSMPNILPERDQNFQGRLIREDGTSEWVELFPTQPAVNMHNINVKIEDDLITGTAKKTISNNYAMAYRNNAAGINGEGLRKWLDQQNSEIDVLRARSTNLNNNDNVIKISYQFETESFFEEIGHKLYISPLLYQQHKENPFKKEKREFPIFFNFPRINLSIISIQIPEDYQIESVPKDKEINLGEDLGKFTYKITSSGNKIIITVSNSINQPVVLGNNYTKFKDFFKQIIEKEAEKIILIKK